jgi:hypothetical protein
MSAAHQRIAFVEDEAGPSQRLVLKGQDLGAVTGPLLWEAEPGTHTLSIVDDERQVLDSVHFEGRPPLMTGDWPPSEMQ